MASVLMLTRSPEAILNGDPHVKSAVMFGRGRFNPGVIIDPKPEFVFDTEDQGKLAEFRNRIWCVRRDFPITNQRLRPRAIMCPGMFFGRGPSDLGPHRPTIERMNEFAPQHSRLFKEACHSFLRPLVFFFLLRGTTAFVCVQALILLTRTSGTDGPGLVPQEAVYFYSETDCPTASGYCRIRT